MRQQHDWPMMIAGLRAAGMSYYKIALACGVPSTHYVKRWGNGVTPLHPHGEKLIELWERVRPPTPTNSVVRLILD